MSIKDLIQELNQINNVAKSELSDMKRHQEWHHEQEYQEGYAEGYEVAMEYFENLIDDIDKLLKRTNIEQVMQSKIVVSENQKKLL